MSDENITIVLANERNFLGVMYIVRQYTRHVNEKGIFHWNLHYPGDEIILDDIKKENLHILKYKGIEAGFIVLSQELNTKSNISYAGKPEDSLFVKRMAILPRFKDRDLEKALLEFAVEKTKEQGMKHLHLEVHPSDANLINVSSEINFLEKGENLMQYQQIPFKCFEKQI